MPSVSLRKVLYDRVVALVGGEKVNDFVNEAVEEKLKRMEEVEGR